MQIKLAFATATALVLLMSAARADDNFANVTQSGSNNSGEITQGHGSHNKIGTTPDSLSPGAAVQYGSNNDLKILQSGSFNEVGTTGQGFDQSGNRNRADITQSSNGNIVSEVQQIDRTSSGSAVRNTLTILQQGGDGNSVDSVRQTRTDAALTNGQAGNAATITQGDTTSGGHNHVGTLSQTGRSNSATVTQSSSSNSLNALRQDGSRNMATVVQQSGDGNKVGKIDQNGADNQASLTFTGAGNGATDFDPLGRLRRFGAFGSLIEGNVSQKGQGNLIRFKVTGDRTAFGFSQYGIANNIDGTVTGNDNQIGVGQDGTANHAGINIGSGNRNDVYIAQISDALSLGNDANVTLAGDRNGIGIVQHGDQNAASVGITGNANLVTIAQSSLLFGNKADVSITGDSNYLDVTQVNPGLGGTGNRLDVSIKGNRNNAPWLGGFSSASLSEALASAKNVIGSNLAPGTIYQAGKGNTITLDVGTTIDSNRNLFAFVQSGKGNGIVGSINGNGNQAVIVQSGSSNFTSFTQIGNYNVVGVSQ